MTDLHEYIASQNKGNKFGLLPLCHTTSEGYFVQIYKTRILKPMPCKEYGESLTYFFYGKSSYFVDPANAINLNAELPIALLFKFDQIEKAAKGFKRLLPFDSGGFDRYGFPNGTDREQFTVFPSKDAPEVHDLIELIYQDNSFYLQDNFINSKLDAEAECCWAVSELANLYNVRVANRLTPAGLQALTVELQVSAPIEINPIAIIFPYELLTANDSKRRKFWTKQKIEEAFPGTDLMIYGEPGTSVAGMDAHLLLRAKVAYKSSAV